MQWGLLSRARWEMDVYDGGDRYHFSWRLIISEITTVGLSISKLYTVRTICGSGIMVALYSCCNKLYNYLTLQITIITLERLLIEFLHEIDYCTNDYYTLRYEIPVYSMSKSWWCCMVKLFGGSGSIRKIPLAANTLHCALYARL